MRSKVNDLYRILLADDDDRVGKTISAYLVRSGLRVHQVFDGEEALAQLGREAYHAMLLDLSMPVLDGMGVLHRMVEQAILIH